jgi:hypothetical protein
MQHLQQQVGIPLQASGWKYLLHKAAKIIDQQWRENMQDCIENIGVIALVDEDYENLRSMSTGKRCRPRFMACKSGRAKSQSLVQEYSCARRFSDYRVNADEPRAPEISTAHRSRRAPTASNAIAIQSRRNNLPKPLRNYGGNARLTRPGSVARTARDL